MRTCLPSGLKVARTTRVRWGSGGVTGSEGSVFRFGYGFGRNFRINATYFMNDTNIDVPTTITGVGAVNDREYKRLQLDINMTF